MQRPSVNSTDINSIGYDPQSAILEVEFHSGGIYRYFDVPSYLHEAFMDASSYGKFLNENIKYNYRYQKIN